MVAKWILSGIVSLLLMLWSWDRFFLIKPFQQRKWSRACVRGVAPETTSEAEKFKFGKGVPLEKIRFRIMVPEFYVIQICKHGRSVVIG